MANVSFYRGSQANLNALSSYVDGRFYLTTDTDRLYVAQSSSELVELNKSITIVDNLNKLPTARNENPTDGISGSQVEVGQFYYVQAGASSKSGNILAVCDSIGEGATGAIHWTQINPDSDHNDDTFVKEISFSKDTTASTTSQLVFNVSIGQETSHITGSNTTASSVTGTLTINSEDVTGILTDTAVDVKDSAVADNKVTIATSGSGHAGTGFEISGGDNITLTDTTNGFSIAAKDTTYVLSMPAVSGATAATTAAINVAPSIGSAYDLIVKAGEDLAINNTTAGEMMIYHKASGVSANTYGNSTTAPSAGGSITVPKIVVDAQGHITSATDVSVTLPNDTYVTAVSASSNGKIIISQSQGSDIISTTADLFYKINKYDAQGNVTTATVLNQGNLGNYYTKEAIDTKLQDLDALTYKGTLGTGGTVTSLPANPGNGDTYKVATAGTYAGYSCNVGDLLIATGEEGANGTIASPQWTLIANGDDTDTTYTFSVADNAIKVTPKGGSLTTIATIEGGNALTASTVGTTITLDHDVSGVTSGTYGLASATTAVAADEINIPKITVDQYGHVTSASNSILKLPAAASLTVNTTTPGLAFNKGSGSDYNIAMSAGTAINVSAATSAITISHANVTHTSTANGGTTGQALSAEGTFDVVSAVAVNDQGHVTNVTTQKYKLPADTTYSLSADSANNSIVLSPSSGSDTSVSFSSDNLTISTTNNNVNMNLEWGSF